MVLDMKLSQCFLTPIVMRVIPRLTELEELPGRVVGHVLRVLNGQSSCSVNIVVLRFRGFTSLKAKTYRNLLNIPLCSIGIGKPLFIATEILFKSSVCV